MPKMRVHSQENSQPEIRSSGLSALVARCPSEAQGLLAAAACGRVQQAERALECGVAPAIGVQALITAAGAGHGAVVELLLARQQEFSPELEQALRGAFGEDLSGIRRASVRRAVVETMQAAGAVRAALRGCETTPLMLTDADVRLVGGRHKAIEIARRAGSKRALVFLDEMARNKPSLELVA